MRGQWGNVVGKTAVPENILIKATSLSDDEEELFKQHTTIGFNILRKIESLSLQVAHVALQHHERYDGQGYPRQLRGDEINEFARIVTVTDLYDKTVRRNSVQYQVIPIGQQGFTRKVKY